MHKLAIESREEQNTVFCLRPATVLLAQEREIQAGNEKCLFSSLSLSVVLLLLMHCIGRTEAAGSLICL